MFCSRNGSPTPLNNIVFLLEVRIKSMSEEEFSVKCVGSLIICSKLNFCFHLNIRLNYVNLQGTPFKRYFQITPTPVYAVAHSTFVYQPML